MNYTVIGIVVVILLIVVSSMMDTNSNTIMEGFTNKVEKFEVSGPLDTQLPQIAEGLKNLKTIADSLVTTNSFTFPGNMEIQNNIVVGRTDNEWGNNIKIRAGQKESGYVEFLDNQNKRQAYIQGSAGAVNVVGGFGVSGQTTVGQNLNVGRDLVVKNDAYFDGEIYIHGPNKWRIHTPDDTRRSLYIAPRSDNGATDMWDKAVELMNTGDLRVGSVTIRNNGIVERKVFHAIPIGQSNDAWIENSDYLAVLDDWQNTRVYLGFGEYPGTVAKNMDWVTTRTGYKLSVDTGSGYREVSKNGQNVALSTMGLQNATFTRVKVERS